MQRVPGGLADMRRPLLSAAAEPVGGIDRPVEAAATESGDDDEDPFAVEDAAAEERSEIAEITKVAEAGSDRVDATPPSASDALFDEDGEPTEQLGVVNPSER